MHRFVQHADDLPTLAELIEQAKADDDGDLAVMVAEIGRHPKLRKLTEEQRWAAALYYTSPDVNYSRLRRLVGAVAAQLIGEHR
jgi:hypothetical protein